MRKMLFVAMTLLCLTAQAGQNELRTITVTGKGEMKLQPDVTQLTVEVRSQHANYQQAYGVAEHNLKQLSEIVESCGLEKTLPKTIYFNIVQRTQPKYDEHRNYLGEERVGYELQQNIRIDLGMDKAQLTQLVRAIGKQMIDVEIQIAYTTADPKPAQLLMLEKAVSDARAKAEIMARTAGCKLDKVASIHHSEQSVRPYVQARKLAAGADMLFCTNESLDINPDDITTTENVTVVWYIK